MQVNGWIYAMVSRGRFVVKLPGARADTLIAVERASRSTPANAGQ